MNIRDISRLVRLPNLIVLAAFQLMLHYLLILPYLEAHGVEVTIPGSRLALLIISTVCLAAGGNAINDYFDVVTDKLNRPDRMVVGKSIGRREAMLVHVLLTLVGVFMGMYLSFVLRRADFMLVFIAVPALLWFYSTHFKKHILIGNIVVALLVALSGYMVISVDYAVIDRVMGSIVTNRQPYSTLWHIVCAYCIFAFISNLAREIIKDLEDAEGDKATGCNTLAVELGSAYTKIVIICVEVFMMVLIMLAYNECEALNEKSVSLAYVVVLLLIPIAVLCVMTALGKSKRDFKRVSVLSKLIMLAGMVTMLLF